MTAGQLERIREASRRAQLLMQDDGLKLETLERLMPVVRQYRELCARLPQLWAAEESATVEEREAALDRISESEKLVRRLHSTLTRTPLNAIAEHPAPVGPPPRLVRCLVCPSGLYYVPGAWHCDRGSDMF